LVLAGGAGKAYYKKPLSRVEREERTRAFARADPDMATEESIQWADEALWNALYDFLLPWVLEQKGYVPAQAASGPEMKEPMGDTVETETKHHKKRGRRSLNS
jgi:hypothetical protein